MGRSRCGFLMVMAMAAGLAASVGYGQTGAVTVASPNGQLQITVSTVSGEQPSAAGGQLVYEVSFRGKPVIHRSALVLELQGQAPLGGNLKLAIRREDDGEETYWLPAGKANPIRSVWNGVSLEYVEQGAAARRLGLRVRAFDDGVAFRYVVPGQPAIPEFRLVEERTHFRIAKDATTYPLILEGFRTNYEDDYHILPLSAFHRSYLVACPLLMELPGVAWVALTEAHIENYAGMYLVRGPDSRTLETKLSPRVDVPGVAVISQTQLQSPWRVIMVADDPGRLIESNIITNLNPQTPLEDISWVRPGKAAWDWWSGSWAQDVSFKPGMNTETMKHYIDFAAENGLEYMLIDAGWAAGGTGPNDSGADLTATIPQIDMPAILAHAKAKNVGIWLWAHWSDVERQMDQAFPLFQKWGVKGVKVDFMDRDDQWMVDFYRRVVRKAAQHRLMVDFHGAFKPDGLRRTLPNLITREAAMCLEFSKVSARITPAHNVMLAFTRMLAGPLDYTPGGFDNVTREEFVPRVERPMVMGTRAHQLALYVVLESPLQMLADYPGAYRGQKELDFLRVVPTSWDETRVLHALVPETVTIARRRGKEWYVGSITDWRAREITIPLSFLGPGEYVAEIYADAPDADRYPKKTVKSERRVKASDTLTLKLVTGGGQAIRFRSAS